VEGTPPDKLSPLHRARLDDLPAALAALVAHRHNPEAVGAAVRLLDAVETMLCCCAKAEWAAWSAAAEAIEAGVHRIEDAQRERLGLRRVEVRGEAGAPPRRVPEVTTAQGRPGRGERSCPRSWRPPDPECGRRRRSL
jgi:hypothetical protein